MHNIGHPSKLYRSLQLISLSSILIVCMFYPTSNKGIILSSSASIILYYLVCSLCLLMCCITNKVNMRRLISVLLLFVYMFAVSINAMQKYNTDISIGRIAPLALLMLSLCFDVKTDKEKQFYEVDILFELITLIMFIWNVMLLLKIPFIVNFTIDNYSQFNWFTTQTQISQSKPVFTFGVHNYGAFLYFLIFFIWYIKIDNHTNPPRRYLVYMILLIIQEFLLRSSSGYILSLFMFLLLLRSKFFKNKKKAIIALILGCIIPLFYFDMGGIVNRIIGDRYNGFISRYSSNLWSQNLTVLKETIFGIGFAIPEVSDIVYSDSGYMVFLTMGSFLLPIIIYSILYFYLRANIRKYSTQLFIFIMLFELALPGVIYMKNIFMLVFIINYCSPLLKDAKRECFNNELLHHSKYIKRSTVTWGV